MRKSLITPGGQDRPPRADGWLELDRVARVEVSSEDPDHPVDRWRIFGAERTSKHQIVWVYNVDYTDGTLCDAELVVRYVHKDDQLARAFFRDVHCEH